MLLFHKHAVVAIWPYSCCWFLYKRETCPYSSFILLFFSQRRRERRSDMLFCNDSSIVLFVFLCGLRASARVKIYCFFIKPVPTDLFPPGFSFAWNTIGWHGIRKLLSDLWKTWHLFCKLFGATGGAMMFMRANWGVINAFKSPVGKTLGRFQLTASSPHTLFTGQSWGIRWNHLTALSVQQMLTNDYLILCMLFDMVS